MTWPALLPSDWFEIGFFFLAFIGLAWPVGLYVAYVFTDRAQFLAPIEKRIYKYCGINAKDDMPWRVYATHLLIFSVICFLGLYGLLRFQDVWGAIPGNESPGIAPDLAFNIAISFVTNTDWQSYSPENTMNMMTQMVGLSVQNFISAAIGLSVFAALTRSFTLKNAQGIGHFWRDMTRSILYILLPMSFILALALISQGSVQTQTPRIEATRLQPITSVQTTQSSDQILQTQTIPLGPVASQIAIKQLGSNGGGYFAANAAHPFENPTGISNLIELVAILLLPAALCFTFGRMIGRKREGIVLLMAMLIIFTPLALFAVAAEQTHNPALTALSIISDTTDMQSGGNMEGKEVRFGAPTSALWAAATTASSNGSTNAAHDSFMPLGGLVPLLLIQFGDVVFGGIGSGLCSMLVFVILSVFITGLMVGRTPEYLGKKIGPFDIKMISIAVLAPHVAALIGTALAVITKDGQMGAFNPNAQGFSEILYAFSSASNNNGSAFSGILSNTPFYNTALGIVMLFSRYFAIIPVLALAGSLAAKNTIPASIGTLRTATPLFTFILVGIIILVGVLTFIPALALGPVAEHFHLMQMRP